MIRNFSSPFYCVNHLSNRLPAILFPRAIFRSTRNNHIVIPDEHFERLLTTLWFNHYVFPVGASMRLHLEFTFLLAGRNLYVTKQIIHTHTYNQRYFTNVNTNDRVSFVIFSIDTPPTLSCSSSGHVLPHQVQLRSFRKKPKETRKTIRNKFNVTESGLEACVIINYLYTL